MNAIMKPIFNSCGLLVVVFFPLIAAAAAASVFSSQGAAISTGVYADYFWINLYVTESASKNKSAETSSSAGAYINGYISDGVYYYDFWGDTTTIEFNATKSGNVPDKVIASGSIPVTGCYWDESYSSCISFSDTITFSINAEALSDQAYSSSGKDFFDSETYKYKQTNSWEDKFAPAFLSESSVIGSFFSETLSEGIISQSKGHTVEIIK